MGKPKAPEAPDYAAAAREQGVANTNSAIATNFLNQANQVNPYGSMTYDYDYANGHRLPDGTVIPRATVKTTLSPEQQKLLDQNNQMSSQLNDAAIKGIGYVSDAASKPIDLSGAAALQTSVPKTNFQTSIAAPTTGTVGSAGSFNLKTQADPTGFGIQNFNPTANYKFNADPTKNQMVNGGSLNTPNLNGQVNTTDFKNQYDFSKAGAMPNSEDFAGQRDQITEALMARMQPYIDRDRQSLEQRMVNQGLGSGSEARSYEDMNFQRGVNDQRMAAILAGSQEQQRLFDNAMGIRQQGTNEAMAQGNLYNTASQARFGQDLSARQFANDTERQLFADSLAAGQFQNQTQAQEFGQNQQNFANYNTAAEMANNLAERQAGFNNTAQNQQFNQNQQQLSNFNNAQNDMYQQSMGNAQLANQANQQQFGQNQAQMEAYNRAQEAMFQQGLAGGQFTNQARQQAIQEQDYLRNAPLNMLNALRSGNQVNMPTFGNVMAGSNIAAAPIYDATQDQYGAEMDQYQAQMANWSAMLGGLGGLGGAAIGKWG